MLFVVEFIPPHALLRGEVLRVLHREMFGVGDYVKGPCCSADGVRVHKEEAAKGPPYVPLRTNLSIRGLLISGCSQYILAKIQDEYGKKD